MTAQELFIAYGNNWSEMMRELKLGVNTYKHWMKIGYIPMPMQKRIEAMTGGRFKSDLTIKREAEIHGNRAEVKKSNKK